MDWVEFQQCLVRRLQSADLGDPVAPFRDTGCYAGSSVSNPRPYILVGVGLLLDLHTGGLELAQDLAGAQCAG